MNLFLVKYKRSPVDNGLDMMNTAQPRKILTSGIVVRADEIAPLKCASLERAAIKVSSLFNLICMGWVGFASLINVVTGGCDPLISLVVQGRFLDCVECLGKQVVWKVNS